MAATLATELKDPVAKHDRESMRERPNGTPLMRQVWRDLVFLHFPVEPETVQKSLPEGLTVDVFPDELGKPMAWVGVVAFRIEGIRVMGLPPLPLLSAFNEVNVRTYAHRDGMEPSVYFFSLDGGPWLTRAIARAWYKVPYRASKVDFERSGLDLRYTSQRPDGPGLDLACRIDSLGTEADSETLDRFLTDRYQLFATNGRSIWKARVAHRPYRIGLLKEFRCRTDLPACAGLPVAEFVHGCWCSEVVADFYRPIRV